MGGCESVLESLCLETIDGEWWGVLFELVLLAYAFAGIAVVADGHLVVALETLCVRWNVREDVAGASFMAFGSAAPEIIFSSIATLKASTAKGGEGEGSDDAATGVGAIIGSGMIAFLAIPGCCGLFAKETLLLKRRPLARDCGTYALAIGLLVSFISDGVIDAGESCAMLLLYGAYMCVVVFSSGIRQLYRVKYLGRAPRRNSNFVTEQAAAPAADVAALSVAPLSAEDLPVVTARPLAADALGETPRWDALPVAQPTCPMEMGHMDISSSLMPPEHDLGRCGAAIGAARDRLASIGGGALVPMLFAVRATCPPCEHDSAHARWYPLTFGASLVWVAIFSIIISAVVSRLGALLRIQGYFLGMFVIAIGAEIPDMIQSVTVARRGYGSMAVSNSCGSQARDPPRRRLSA